MFVLESWIYLYKYVCIYPLSSAHGPTVQGYLFIYWRNLNNDKNTMTILSKKVIVFISNHT